MMPRDYSANASDRAEARTAKFFYHKKLVEKQSLAIIKGTSLSEYLGMPPLADGCQNIWEQNAAASPETCDVICSIQETSPVRVKAIFAKWDRLGALVRYHRHTIKHRWEKRTVEKRKLVLIEAWSQESKIPPRRQPNFDAYKRGLKGDKYKWAYLTPNINLEDLSDKTNLLLFIEARATHEPSLFASADASILQMAAENGCDLPLTVGYSMLLSGEPRSTYGRIVSWGLDVQSFVQNETALYEGKEYLLGEGFVALEIQEKILSFLLNSCEYLLSDIDLADLVPFTRNSTQSDVAFQCDSENSTNLALRGSYSVMETHARAKYDVPQQLDLNYLRRLVASKVAEAVDDIWSLREDPIFFREAVTERISLKEGLWNAFISIQAPGQKRTSTQDQVIFKESCQDVVLTFYRRVFAWNILSEDLELLERLQDKYKAEISPFKSSPQEYNGVLWIFSLSVEWYMNRLLQALALRTAFSPKLGKYYQFHLDDEKVVAKPNSATLHHCPSVVVLLNDLQDCLQRQKFGTSDLLDAIGRTIHLDETKSSQRGLIDSPTATMLSELAPLGELESQIMRHRPRIRTPEDGHPWIKMQAERFEVRNSILITLKKEKEFPKLCQPLSAFGLPASNSKRTEQKVSQLRAAEAKLDAFWQYADELFINHTGKSLNELFGTLFKERKLQRTPVWEPLATGPKPIKQPSIIFTVDQLQNLRLSEQGQDKVVLPAIPRPKMKTRGEADPASLSPAEGDVAMPAVQPPARHFVLPKKAYKVMLTLFPTEQEREPGKVRWLDFVDAMCKVGFSSHQSAGSSVSFEPSWGETPISFHRPHPGDELTHVYLRRYGRRLGRRYGWTSESFVSE